jgi:flagellar biogenesis protein FliO
MMELLPLLLIGFLGTIASFLLWKQRRGATGLGSKQPRRLEQLERVILSHQHSVHLIRVEGRWLALGVTPKGIDLLESGDLAPVQSVRSIASDVSQSPLPDFRAILAKAGVCGS